MPFSQVPARIAYPPVQTQVWVAISRLSEAPLRVVPSLSFINHASEFALPFPSGRVPYKVATRTFDVQVYNDIGQPLYDDGTQDGTTDDTDINGLPYPPKMTPNTEDQLVSLRDYPELFSLNEIQDAVINDFLRTFPFYTHGQLILFDDRYDEVSRYDDQNVTTGLASGTDPLFLGPFQGSFDNTTTPRGHVLLIAPQITGVNWFFQIRHGVAGSSGFMGPIQDIEIASRQQGPTYQELTPIFPMSNLELAEKNLTDSNATEVSHFWLRSVVNTLIVDTPYPIIPFVVVLVRKTGSSQA